MGDFLWGGGGLIMLPLGGGARLTLEFPPKLGGGCRPLGGGSNLSDLGGGGGSLQRRVPHLGACGGGGGSLVWGKEGGLWRSFPHFGDVLGTVKGSLHLESVCPSIRRHLGGPTAPPPILSNMEGGGILGTIGGVQAFWGGGTQKLLPHLGDVLGAVRGSPLPPHPPPS